MSKAVGAGAFVILLSIGPAFADVTLLCHVDLPGAADRGRDTIVVPGASTLEEACDRLRNDPLYGEYNWRQCISALGAGSCAAGGGTGSPPPPPVIGRPPSPPIGPASVEPNVNRQGYDYAGFALEAANPDLCRTTCEQDPFCRAYTYVHPGIQGPNAMCWLKSAAPLPAADPCCISGTR